MSVPQWEVFLDLLQQREAVPEKLVRHLRKQLQRKQPPPSARSVAAWLVDHGHLTRFQALELLRAVGAAEDSPKSRTSAAAEATSSPLPEATSSPSSEEDRFEGSAPSPPSMPTTPALLDDLESLDAGMDLGPAAVQPGSPPPGWAPPRIKRSVWESPLFLLGGGGLILLVVIAVGLYWAIGRESADQLLQSAEEDYNNGSYTQAIEKFERFLDYFPDHTQAGHVRVLRGLAIMRRTVDQSSDWEKTLQIVEETIQSIRKEKEFPEARPELAALLPRVAEGLTDMAEQRESAELLEKARQVYQMIVNPNYVPDKLRNRTRLATLEGRFSQIERMLGRNRRLSQALQEIQQAISQKQTRQAYEIRRQLLKEYPELETHPELQKAIARATDAEREAIGYRSAPQQPQASPPQFKSSTLPVAHTQGKTVPEAKGRMLFVTGGGAVWAIAAEDGKVRWRRYLGKDLWLLPLTLSDRTPEDVVVWSPQHKQLWCLQGGDGSLRWFVPLPGEPVADLVAAGGRLWVAVENRLWEIGLRDGKVLGTYEFPQSLSAPPAISGSHMFLPAGHSNVYVIDFEKQSCVGAYYLGHEQDTIAVAPVLAGPFVVLAENAGRESSRLRVLRYDAKKHTLQLVQSVRLKGQVFRPLLLQGRLLAAATDLGQISLFEVNPNPQKNKKPLSPVASRAAVFEKPGPVQLLLDGAYAWIADRQLTRYRIQAAEGQMTPDRVLLEKVAFPLPLKKQGDALFAVAQHDDGTVQVAAFSTTNGQAIWTTRFATPMSWTPLRSKDGPAAALFLVDRRGNVYRPQWPSGADASAAAISPQWSPARLAQLPRRWMPLGKDVWVGRIASGARRLPVLRRTDSQSWQLQWHELPEALLIPPIPWQDKLLLASDSAPLFVFDPLRGRMIGSPYFPSMVPGDPPQWLPVVGSSGKELVLVSRRGHLLVFDRLPGEQEALSPARQKSISGPLQGPVVLFARAAWLSNSQGQLLRISLPDLKSSGPSPADKQTSSASLVQPLWGPVFLGSERAIWLGRDGRLHCLSSEKLLSWQPDLSGQLPVGEPVRVGTKECLLAIASGQVLRLDLERGTVRRAYRVPEALAGSPLLLDDNHVLLPTSGGALHMLEAEAPHKVGAWSPGPSRR